MHLNRRTKIAAVAAALFLTASAAGSAVASGDGRGGSREAAALTGSAKLYRPAGDDITFTFDAHLAARDNMNPGAATGTFRFSHYVGGKGGYAVAKVDCLVTGGPVAVVTGRVVETDVKEYEGARVGVSVLDQGRHDRLGYSWMTQDPEAGDVPPCQTAPPFEKVLAGTGDFQVLPWLPEYPRRQPAS